MIIGNNSTSSIHLPYEECLIPNLPVEIQLLVREITNYGVRPLNMLVALLSIVLNAFVISTVARIRSLQHPSLIMLCSLGLTDIIQASYSFSGNIEAFAHKHKCPSGNFAARNMIPTLFQSATLGNLAIISGDRYLAVIKLWWYRNHMTKSRATKLICVPWLMSFVNCMMAYVSIKGVFGPLGITVVFAYFIICVLVILCSNIGILVSVTRHKGTLPEEGQQLREIRSREKRLACTVRLILLNFSLTFVPAYLIGVILFSKGVKSPYPFGQFFGFLFLLNRLLNPLVNFRRNREVRQAVKAALRCCCLSQVRASGVGVARDTKDELDVAASRKAPSTNLGGVSNTNVELHAECSPKVQPTNVGVACDTNGELHAECSPEVQPSYVGVARDTNGELHAECSPEVQPSNVGVACDTNGELHAECSPEVQPSNVGVARDTNGELHAECSPEVQPSNVGDARDTNGELHAECSPEVQPSNFGVARDTNGELYAECSPEVQPSNVGVARDTNGKLHAECSPEVQPSCVGVACDMNGELHAECSPEVHPSNVGVARDTNGELHAGCSPEVQPSKSRESTVDDYTITAKGAGKDRELTLVTKF